MFLLLFSWGDGDDEIDFRREKQVEHQGLWPDPVRGQKDGAVKERITERAAELGLSVNSYLNSKTGFRKVLWHLA